MRKTLTLDDLKEAKKRMGDMAVLSGFRLMPKGCPECFCKVFERVAEINEVLYDCTVCTARYTVDEIASGFKGKSR